MEETLLPQKHTPYFKDKLKWSNKVAINRAHHQLKDHRKHYN